MITWKGLEQYENLNCLLKKCKIDYTGGAVKRNTLLKVSLSFERKQVGDYKIKAAFKEHPETLTLLSFVHGQQRAMQ